MVAKILFIFNAPCLLHRNKNQLYSGAAVRRRCRLQYLRPGNWGQASGCIRAHPGVPWCVRMPGCAGPWVAAPAYLVL